MQTAASRSAAYSGYNYNYSAEASNSNYQSASRQKQTFETEQNSNQRYSQAENFSREGNQSQFGNQLQGRNELQFGNQLQGRNESQFENQLQGRKESQFGNQLQGRNESQFSDQLQARNESQFDSTYSEAENRQSSLRSQVDSRRQTSNNSASAESNSRQDEGSTDNGDFFATYGTKKECRTVQKKAQMDESAERNEESEQSQRRDNSQEASARRLDTRQKNEEGQQSQSRSGNKEAAAKSLAGAKKASRVEKEAGRLKEKKSGRQAGESNRREREKEGGRQADKSKRREREKEDDRQADKSKRKEREKDRRQQAKGSERDQGDESQNNQVPPPLPPKPSESKRQNESVRLDAIERKLPELQNVLRMLQQEKASSPGSDSSTSNAQPDSDKSKPVEALVESKPSIRTQSTATEPVKYSKTSIPHANANVGTDEKLSEHRNQSTETADFHSGLLGSVVASSESKNSRGTVKQVKSNPAAPQGIEDKIRPPDSDPDAEIDDNTTPSSQKAVHAPATTRRNPGVHKSDPEVVEDLTPNSQPNVQAPHSGQNGLRDSDESGPEIDESFAPNTHKDVKAHKTNQDPTDSEETDSEIDDNLAPNVHKDVQAPKTNQDPTDSEETDPEFDDDMKPTAHTNVQAPPSNQSEPEDSEETEPEISDDMPSNSCPEVQTIPDDRTGSDSLDDLDEDITPNSQPNVQAPLGTKADSNPTVHYQDFSQHVFSDRDSVLEEFITPESVPVVFQPTERSEKPKKLRPSEVDIPAPLDDPQVNQPAKEKRKPINETIEKSVSRLVELEPDFRWMFGDKCEQTDEIINPLVNSVFSTEPSDKPMRVDASIDPLVINPLVNSVFSTEHSDKPKSVDASIDVQNDLLIDDECPTQNQSDSNTTVITNDIYRTSTEHSTVLEQSRSQESRELINISEKEQYLKEIARLKTVVSELEKRVFVHETVRIHESHVPSSTTVHRRTVGLMVKPPCRDVAINIFIEDAKPAQRSVGVNVSVDDNKPTPAAVNSVRVAELPKGQDLTPRPCEARESQRTDVSSSSTSIATISSQKLMFFQSLRQTYGITATEMVNIIAELLKRDVKSVGIQVCLDSLVEHPDFNSDGAEFEGGRGILRTSSRFNNHSDATSVHTKNTSGSRFDSSVVSRRYDMDSAAESASHSLEGLTGLGSPDAVSRITDSAQHSSIASKTESGWQGQEESSNQEFQYTSDDGTVTTSRTVASRRMFSRQVLPESSFSTSASATHTSAAFQQQQVASSRQSNTQRSYTQQSEVDSIPDGQELDFGDKSLKSSVLHSQRSFSQSAQQASSTVLSSVTHSQQQQFGQRLVHLSGSEGQSAHFSSSDRGALTGHNESASSGPPMRPSAH